MLELFMVCIPGEGPHAGTEEKSEEQQLKWLQPLNSPSASSSQGGARRARSEAEGGKKQVGIRFVFSPSFSVFNWQ